MEDAFLNRNYATHFGFLESQLASSPGGGQYLCGKELTAADVMMSFPLIAANSRGKIDKAKYTKLVAYVEMIESSEGYQKSVKKIEETTNETFKA